MKPVVTAEGRLGLCCGEQYMLDPPKRDYVADWGTTKDIEKIWKEQKKINRNRCVKCYYDNYNKILAALMKDIKHKEFV